MGKTELFAAVDEYLSSRSYKYRTDEEEGTLSLMLSSSELPFRQVEILWIVSELRILVYGVCPVSVPEERRADVATYLTRANFGLRIGNFELDMNDGEVRYKVSMDLENDDEDSDPPTVEQIRNAMSVIMNMLRRYVPGMMQVMYGGADPKKACAEADNG